MDVDPASRQFSKSSFRADAGLWMIFRGENEKTRTRTKGERSNYFSSGNAVYQGLFETSNRQRIHLSVCVR